MVMTTEIWKVIPGYGGHYEVSDMGRVRSVTSDANRRQRVLRPNTAARYRFVSLCFPGMPRSRTIHRLVAEAFVPNPSGLPSVNHKDANKANNAASNLEWVTPAQNSAHAKTLGLMSGPGLGVMHPNSKLDGDDVYLIRRRLDRGESLTVVAADFGITASNASYIYKRKTWKHVA